MRPLQGMIKELCELDGGSLLGYYVKGHVDKAEFLAELDFDYEVAGTEQEVKHLYVRNVPAGTGDGEMEMLPATPGKRGAYKITLLDLEARAIRNARTRMDLPATEKEEDNAK